LLKSLQNFLVNAAERTHTGKRGGNVQFVSWDDWMAEAPSQLSISAHTLDSLPPERLFDLRWAVTVVEHALQRLREECESKGKRRLFQALSCYLTAERDEVSYANLSTATSEDTHGYSGTVDVSDAKFFLRRCCAVTR
jgi:hypothetical protein